MPNISVDVTGFYFGISNVDVDTNDSVGDAMRKAVAKSVSDNAADPSQPVLIFESDSASGFCTRLGAIHFEPPQSRQLNNPEGLDLQAGIYVYEDKALGQTLVPSWQYYVIDEDRRPKTRRDPASGDRYIVPNESSNVAGDGGVPAALELAEGDTIIWRLITIAFGRSGPLPAPSVIEQIQRATEVDLMQSMRPKKFSL
ncbi:MAG: hypothetical protein AAGG48_23745 [Planctomycetota bacterium]